MTSSFQSELKRELQLPPAREAVLILVWVLGISVALVLLQWLARPMIDTRFSLDSASFPLALGPFERAGSYSNLVGWGYFLNDWVIDSPNWWLCRKLVEFAFVVAFARLLWYGPLVMQAGAIANTLEGYITGQVLDWIVLPDGAEGVRALSLGDIAIYGGLVPCAFALSLKSLHVVRAWWSFSQQATRTR